MLQTFIQIVLVGLAVGAAYALVALGYTLIWNAVSLVNFAQGDLVMVGAFVSVGWLANRLGLPLWLNLVTMLVILGFFGAGLAWGIYHPLRNAPQLSAIVATLANPSSKVMATARGGNGRRAARCSATSRMVRAGQPSAASAAVRKAAPQ